MQVQRASFACTALLGTNKVGVLKPTEDGYYPVVLGALNIYNSGGAYYPYDSAKSLFLESSALMRRIANGALRGEYGHPRPAGMSTRDFLMRVMDILETNVSHHIRKVWIDYSGQVKDSSGRACIAIMGEVKPCGPMGAALLESLNNPSENVCFSIRSLTNDQMVGGTLFKHLKTIVTWDYVNEPGLEVAKKWHAPTLESFTESSFVPEQLQAVQQQQEEMRKVVGMESNGGLTAAEIMADFGWDKVTVAVESIEIPPSARW